MKTWGCEEYNVQVPQNKTAAKLSALRKRGFCISALVQTQYLNTKAKIYFKNTTLYNVTRNSFKINYLPPFLSFLVQKDFTNLL